ncbi:hypothetical protein MPH_13965 [Macrophomina phaseolina MS6]|uniref:Uncharacterized protein n=1 Tax=Macrophomina phaseolina (strain MS6) TaxID=1126212 RepID=K2RXF2_MACPH|nr:hypothetical protein MPH_13965 [Macrophomina phaseolina MS6]
MHVHWVIRPGGKGPCWFAPSTVSPFKFKAESLARTRAMTFLSPCIWGDADGFGWVRSLFHRTFLGQKIVDWFHLGLIQAGMEGSAGYGKNPNLQKLRPWRDMFWIGAGSASQNYTKPDVFELVRQGKIEVHIANVESLGEKEVRLGNGQVFRDVEALVCATGWTLNPTIKFFRDGVDIAAELGLPHAFGKMDEEEKALVARADAEILKAMPRLKAQPAPARPPYLQQTPYEVKDPAEETMEETFKLYRFMVPPSKIATRTLAFSGMTRDVSAPMIAEVQSLWLSAFFSHQIPSLEPSLPSSLVTSSPKSSSTAIEQADTVMHAKQARAQISARVKYESILHARYGLWRYPHGFGAVMPDIFYDFVPLFDLMISELGLRSWRKGSLMKEIFTGYMPRDYAGLVDEWVEMRKRGLSPSESAKVESRRVLLTVAMGVFPWVAMMFCTLVWVYRIKAMEL